MQYLRKLRAGIQGRDQPQGTKLPRHRPSSGPSLTRNHLLGSVAVAAFVVGTALITGPHSAAAQAPSNPCAEAAQSRNYLTVELDPTGRLPGLEGCGRLAIEWSPFGIAVSRDGHVRYKLDLYLDGIEGRRRPAAQETSTYIAWAVSPDLEEIHRLGVVENGRATGSVWLNQFLLVVTAEASPETAEMAGPILIRGRSPTGWIEPFQHHDPFGVGMPIRR